MAKRPFGLIVPKTNTFYPDKCKGSQGALDVWSRQVCLHSWYKFSLPYLQTATIPWGGDGWPSHLWRPSDHRPDGHMAQKHENQKNGSFLSKVQIRLEVWGVSTGDWGICKTTWKGNQHNPGWWEIIFKREIFHFFDKLVIREKRSWSNLQIEKALTKHISQICNVSFLSRSWFKQTITKYDTCEWGSSA